VAPAANIAACFKNSRLELANFLIFSSIRNQTGG
jgi:hypothetical protein